MEHGAGSRHPSPLLGSRNQEEMRTDYAIKIPYALGIIATRSLDGQVTGLRISRASMSCACATA